MRFAITHIERGRFRVVDFKGSRRKQLVDVCGNHGEGLCSCENFNISKVLNCKHLKAVWEFLGRRVSMEMHDRYNDGDEQGQI